MEIPRFKNSNLQLIRILILISSLVSIGRCKEFNLRYRRSEITTIINDNESNPCIEYMDEDETEVEVIELTPTPNSTMTTISTSSPMTTTSNFTNYVMNRTSINELHSTFSEEFIECAEVGGLYTIKAECYEKWENGTVYMSKFSASFDESNYYINERGMALVCLKKTKITAHKFDDWLGVATVTGVAISMLCIILHMFMFLTLQKLRNLPGYCLFSLCCALITAYTSYFIGSMNRPEGAYCTAAGLITYFSFLCSFFWMNIMSYDVWRSLRLATAKLRLTGDRPMLVRFGMYSLYSWGTPLLILIIALIITSVIPKEIQVQGGNTEWYKYRVEIDMRTCWFLYKPALGVYFAFPIFSLMIVNVLLYVHSSFMISSATMKTSENGAFLWNRFLVSLRLAVVMGLTWIFGAIATASQQHVFNYFFSLCIALQGVFIFFSFTVTDKTKKAFMIAIKRKKTSSMMPSCTQHVTSF